MVCSGQIHDPLGFLTTTATSLSVMPLEPVWMCVQVLKGGSCKITVLGHDDVYYGKYLWVFQGTFLPTAALSNPKIHKPENLSYICLETGLSPLPSVRIKLQASTS